MRAFLPFWLGAFVLRRRCMKEVGAQEELFKEPLDTEVD